ncbi:MAG: hypothetical protein QXE90_04165 [Candidatus Micrarchaeia archaeon]
MIESNLSEQPCTVPTAAQSVYRNYRFEISVWNCKASLLCFTEDKSGKRKYYSLQTMDNSLSETTNRLAEKSVYDVGSAINFSGIYPLNKELEEFLEKNLDNKKIILKKE